MRSCKDLHCGVESWLVSRSVLDMFFCLLHGAHQLFREELKAAACFHFFQICFFSPSVVSLSLMQDLLHVSVYVCSQAGKQLG